MIAHTSPTRRRGTPLEANRRAHFETARAPRCHLGLVSLLAILLPAVAFADSPRVIIVVGAEGTAEYGGQFRTWAERWQAAAKQGGAECLTVGLDAPGDKSDRELLEQHIASGVSGPLWLVLIGHGTFDGKTARFNLRGPDVTPADLSQWLNRGQPEPTAMINCTSASGPFIAELSGPGRVVITATRSGHEYNFARLGDYLSQAIMNPQADLDKDEQTSLLEAILVAAARVREFYTSETRLATEHALVDDNGDRLGTPAEWFRGLRPTKSAKDGAALDGSLAAQLVLVRSDREQQLPAALREKRDALEQKLAELRQRKSQLPEEEYLKQLEPLLVEIARLYE